MKIGPMFAIAVMVGASPQPGNAGQGERQKVTVYVENDARIPSPLLSRARVLAGEMFAGVGLQIDWRAGARPDSQLVREHAIAIRLTPGDPEISTQRSGLHRTQRGSPYNRVVEPVGVVVGETRLGFGAISSRVGP